MCQVLDDVTTVVFVVDTLEVVADGPGEVLQVPVPPILDRPVPHHLLVYSLLVHDP